MEVDPDQGRDQQLLDQLVHCLAISLGFDFAVVGLVEPDGEHVLTLAATLDGERGTMRYSLRNSPCVETLRLGEYVVTDGVVERFPDDADLSRMGVRSYVGARFEDPVTGRYGLVVACSRSAIERSEQILPALRTFAASARAARGAQGALLSAALVRGALDESGQGYFVVARDGRIESRNEAASRWMRGRGSEGDRIDEVFASSADWVERAVLRGERATGRVGADVDRGTGDRTIVECDVLPVGDGSAFMVVLVRDVTRAVEREERLQLALDASGAGLWDWSIVSGNLQTNARYMQMLGESAKEARLTILAVADRLHPDDFPRTFEALARAQACPDSRYDVEFRMRCADGSYKWLRSSGRVVERGPLGEPLRMIGYHIDIDAEKRSEQAHRVVEGHMRLLFEHTVAAIAMLDRDMRYIVASRGWYEQYGLDQDSVIGQSHYDVFPTIPDRWRELHRRALAGEILDCDRDSFDREDGLSTHLRWSLHPWRDAHDEIGGIVMFTQVINEQVRYEDSLRDARDAAIAASRARGDFLANMSHEIRTPMTAILGFADLLDSDPENREEYVRTIRRNGRHLLEIVNSLLDLSKIDAGKMTVERLSVDLPQLFDELHRTFSERAHECGLQFDLVCEEGAPNQIGSDPLRLRQILNNLVANAIKFTPSGRVSIRLGAADRAAGRVVVEINDTGIGMTAEQMTQVFQAFVQGDGSTTRRFGGSGLGLCISRRLAELLGGRLDVRSEVGVGSTFTLELPLVELPNESRFALEQPAAALPHRSLAGMRVLLAEDGADNRRLVSVVLTRSGAHVTCVENGSLVVPELERAHGEGRPYGLVLMDMQMPVVDGYHATPLVRAAGFDVPVIALTAHAMSGDRERCLAAGCDDFLTKPIDRALLESTLARLGVRVAHD